MASLLAKNESIELSKRRIRFRAHSDRFLSTNPSRIRINVDVAEEHIDFENSYLVFNIQAVGGTTDIGLPRYISSSWIHEIRFKDRAGNQIGENLQNYNVMARAFYEQHSTLDQEKSYLDVLEGAQGDALSTRTTTTDKQYIHRFVSHIGAMKNYFPAKYLGGLIIEIDMEQSANVVLQTSGESGGSYIVSNLAFVAKLIKLKPEVEAVILQGVQNGLKIDYVSSHTTIANETTTSGTQRFDLGTMNGRVKSITQISVPTKANASVDEKNTFSRNGLTSYRFRLGSRYLSESQIDMGANAQAEYLMEYLESQKLTTEPYGLYGSESLTKAVLLGDSIGGKFVIGQSADRSKTDEVLSSLKDKDNNRLESNRSYASPSANQLYTFVQLDKRMIIMPGKQFIDNDFSGEGTIMSV